MNDRTVPFHDMMSQLQEQLLEAERMLPGPVLEQTRNIVASILEAHRLGLESLTENLAASKVGRDLLVSAAADDPARSLLNLHGLHPDPLDVRVRRAIQVADVAMAKLGTAEWIEMKGSTVTVRVSARSGAQVSDLSRALCDAMDAHAPDATFELLKESSNEPELIPANRLAEGAR